MLAWHGYRRIFETPALPKLKEWPQRFEAFGDCGLFHLLVGLACVPRIRAWHRSLNIPADVTAATCHQLVDFGENYRRGHDGELGAYVNQLPWLRHYTREPYFRLGRMEYWLKLFSGAVTAFRHKRTRQVVALAADGSGFDRDGYRAGVGDPNRTWEARYRETADAFEGVVVLPLGKALVGGVHLPRADWTAVLRKDDLVLDMHIPQGGGLTPEACVDSHRRALEFFPRYFPDRPFVALVCLSWMFNMQLEEILLPDANLVLGYS